ncbi:MAG: HAMP domain-containing sensor histidine kinase [Polyangiales bacterium]
MLDALTLLACAGHLTLGALALFRGARSPMAIPLALLCADFFAFNAAPLAERISGVPGWAWIDAASSSMLAPLSVHVLVAFAGRRRELSRLLYVGYAVHGAIAGACVLAFARVSWAQSFARSSLWAAAVLGVGLPFLVVALALVIPPHWRRNPDAAERARTKVMLAAFAIGTLLCPTELLADMGVAVPKLANVGTLASTLLFTLVTLRHRLFDRDVSLLLALKAAVVGVLSLIVYVAKFRYLASAYSMALFGVLTLALGLLPALRDVVQAQTVERERSRHLATLGRFSAQMAHDLQNPLAAAKGATQLLLRARGDEALTPSQAEYARLIHEQMDRMLRVITDYRRLGRLEADLADGDLARVASEVVAAQTNAAPPGVTLRLDAPSPVPCVFDRDLVIRALENLVKNAFQATQEGEVTVSARGEVDGFVELRVRDTGAGMSPRVAEQALDDFFTTRATGSGLGLALVRRVAEAHGGGVSIESAEGRGTTISLRLRADGR